MGCHVEHIPASSGLVLIDLLTTVVLGPGHTVGPHRRCQRNRPFETGLPGHGACIDQYPVLNRLSTGIGRITLPKKIRRFIEVFTWYFSCDG